MKTYFDKSYSLPVCKYRGKLEDIKLPTYASLKLDGELQYIIKKDKKIFSVNKSKYGRWRFDYPALKEFQSLNLPDGIYLAELYWNEGRTKEDFYGLLRHKTSDELRLGIWGILQIEDKIDISTEETYKFLTEIKGKTKDFKYLSVSPFWKIENEKQLWRLVNHILDEGWEGLVIRNMDAVYNDGQTIKWIKIKKKERELLIKNKNGKVNNLRLDKYGVWL